MIESWDEGHRELGISLDGTPDEDLWKQPHPNLRSIGEVAGHMMYWEARMSISPDELGFSEGSTATISSPLIDPRFDYYGDNENKPIRLEMTTAELMAEIKRIHGIARAKLIEMNPDPAAPVTWSPKWHWSAQLQYRVFHTAYHTGQIYSVRLMLGHTPEDN